MDMGGRQDAFRIMLVRLSSFLEPAGFDDVRRPLRKTAYIVLRPVRRPVLNEILPVKVVRMVLKFDERFADLVAKDFKIGIERPSLTRLPLHRRVEPGKRPQLARGGEMIRMRVR